MTIQPLYMKIIGTMWFTEETWQELTPMIGFSITESTMIGSRRLHSRNLVFHHAHISRQHARLTLKDGHWYIEDLSSENGTVRLVSGEPREVLKGPILITQDMIVLLGIMVVQFDLSVVEDEILNLL